MRTYIGKKDYSKKRAQTVPCTNDLYAWTGRESRRERGGGKSAWGDRSWRQPVCLAHEYVDPDVICLYRDGVEVTGGDDKDLIGLVQGETKQGGQGICPVTTRSNTSETPLPASCAQTAESL